MTGRTHGRLPTPAARPALNALGRRFAEPRRYGWRPAPEQLGTYVSVSPANDLPLDDASTTDPSSDASSDLSVDVSGEAHADPSVDGADEETVAPTAAPPV